MSCNAMMRERARKEGAGEEKEEEEGRGYIVKISLLCSSLVAHVSVCIAGPLISEPCFPCLKDMFLFMHTFPLLPTPPPLPFPFPPMSPPPHADLHAQQQSATLSTSYRHAARHSTALDHCETLTSEMSYSPGNCIMCKVPHIMYFTHSMRGTREQLLMPILFLPPHCTQSLHLNRGTCTAG